MASKTKNDTCVENFDTSFAKSDVNSNLEPQKFAKNEPKPEQNECKSEVNNAFFKPEGESEVVFDKNSININKFLVFMLFFYAIFKFILYKNV